MTFNLGVRGAFDATPGHNKPNYTPPVAFSCARGSARLRPLKNYRKNVILCAKIVFFFLLISVFFRIFKY